MKNLLYYAAMGGAGLAVIAALMIGLRSFSNATTPIIVKQVAPGIQCATMVTGDGAAIDCWKSENREESK